ncbi:MAG: sigma-70 family RNA polymerase sigma factor [Actinomycetes bacterium]
MGDMNGTTKRPRTASKVRSTDSTTEDAAATRTPAEVAALVEAHLDLVHHVVFQVAVHFPRHVDRDDLARAGALGLVEAARRYEESRGVPFNRFAAQRIRGAIIDHVRAADWAPRSVRVQARRLDAVELELSTRLGRAPSSAETAAALGMSLAELASLRERLHRSVVLAFEHMTVDTDDEELSLLDVIEDRTAVEPSAELEDRELHAYLRDAVALLPERHRLVVVGYFLEERTSDDLSRFLGVTESRISQMRSEALAMLKDGIERQYRPEVEDEPVVDVTLVERRRARYAEAIGSARAWDDRIVELDEVDVALAELLAGAV